MASFPTETSEDAPEETPHSPPTAEVEVLNTKMQNLDLNKKQEARRSVTPSAIKNVLGKMEDQKPEEEWKAYLDHFKTDADWLLFKMPNRNLLPNFMSLSIEDITYCLQRMTIDTKEKLQYMNYLILLSDLHIRTTAVQKSVLDNTPKGKAERKQKRESREATPISDQSIKKESERVDANGDELKKEEVDTTAANQDIGVEQVEREVDDDADEKDVFFDGLLWKNVKYLKWTEGDVLETQISIDRDKKGIAKGLKTVDSTYNGSMPTAALCIFLQGILAMKFTLAALKKDGILRFEGDSKPVFTSKRSDEPFNTVYAKNFASNLCGLPTRIFGVRSLRIGRAAYETNRLMRQKVEDGKENEVVDNLEICNNLVEKFLWETASCLLYTRNLREFLIRNYGGEEWTAKQWIEAYNSTSARSRLERGITFSSWQNLKNVSKNENEERFPSKNDTDLYSMWKMMHAKEYLETEPTTTPSPIVADQMVSLEDMVQQVENMNPSKPLQLFKTKLPETDKIKQILLYKCPAPGCGVERSMHQDIHEMKDHISSCAKQILCTVMKPDGNICNKRCSSQKELNDHAKHHSPEYRWVCTQCDMRYEYESHLSRHLISHSDDNLYKCDLCPLSYKHKSSLTRHKKDKHLSPRSSARNQTNPTA